jgi:ethanolamine utilization protein EutN
MYLARVEGRVVATTKYEGLEGVPLQWIQPLDETGEPDGAMLVACSPIGSGPGDLVHYVDGREAALACPVTYVPVDATITGFIEEVETPRGVLRQRRAFASSRSPQA